MQRACVWPLHRRMTFQIQISYCDPLCTFLQVNCSLRTSRIVSSALFRSKILQLQRDAETTVFTESHADNGSAGYGSNASTNRAGSHGSRNGSWVIWVNITVRLRPGPRCDFRSIAASHVMTCLTTGNDLDVLTSCCHYWLKFKLSKTKIAFKLYV